MTLFLLVFFAADIASKPLPDAVKLRARAVESMRVAAQALERYSCDIETDTEELDANGQVRRKQSKRSERFYVNGVEINHVLARDGKTLSGREAEKEQIKTDREVEKYSKQGEAEQRTEKREKQFEMFLRSHRLLNGQRLQRDGHNTLQYELQADPQFHPHSIEERFSQATDGRVTLDEQSGALVELEIRTNRDVRIGGGLLANLHKGFQVHAICERQPDGIWLAKQVDGSADVRAGLFFHPRIRFHEKITSCRLFSVDSIDLSHSERP